MFSSRRGLPGRLSWLPLLLSSVLLTGCAGDYPLSTFRPVTQFGVDINDLFTYIFWWTMVVLAIVIAVLAYVVIRFRERPGVKAKQIYGHTGLEMGWTLGPAIIVAFIAVPTVRAIFATQAQASEDALVVEVTGHQWWWEFEYPEYGVVTAGDLVLPVGREVTLRLRSADVIHSFWIPRFGGKKDANPGAAAHAEEGRPPAVNRLTFTVEEPGVYPGVCAEYCGLSHAIMRMYGVAVDETEFNAWVQDMREPSEPAAGTLEERGREVFLTRGCTACHTIEGTPAVGVIGPNLTLFGRRNSIAAGLLDNTPENLREWISDPPAVKPGALMPSLGLNDDELEAVAAYLLSLR